MTLPLEDHLLKSWPPAQWADCGVLVAVSGGADSVALLTAMAALAQRHEGKPPALVAAHFNHRLRGEESDADEAFVARLAEELGVPCKVGHAADSRLAKRPNTSEDASRRQRYRYLQATAEQLGLRCVATAHTADDQAETIVHRMLRGTGLAGLSGMARARRLGSAVSLVRPLLEVRRAEVLAYLDAKGQAYRVDSSNASAAFTRNRIRRELLPHWVDIHPEAVEAICRLGRLAAEAQSVLDGLVERLAERCVARHSADEVHLARGPLKDQPGYLVRELFAAVWRRQGWPRQAMGLAQWTLLAEMVSTDCTQPARAAKRQLPGGVCAEVHGDALRLYATRPPPDRRQ